MILKDKNAIITGARKGIGRATVEVFAQNGANIWACARSKNDDFEADMKDLSLRYKVQIIPVYFDIGVESEVKEAVQKIRSEKKPIDILVNNAGIAEESTSFQMTPITKMKYVMDINFFSATLLTQYISRIMVRQNYGSIVNVASVAGIDGTPAQYEYAASKAALIGATKQLSRDLAPYNIRVNAIAPGVIDTEMGNKIEPQLKQEMIQKTVMKRLGKPEEVAKVIAFVASDMASYITCQVLRVDGGI